MRLVHVLASGALLLCLIPACGGDDSGGDPPDDSGGESGSGGSGGKSTAGSSSVAGKPSGGAGGKGGGASAGTDAGGMDAGGEAGMSGAGGDPNPVDCSKLATAPAMYEIIEGVGRSEDFVFDADGNYVGIDDNGNLVRVPKGGKPQLWLPAMGLTAGMGILPDGSVIICDVTNGALRRVYESGASQIVIGGLLYPNGLDIGPDGFVYVAENSAGRARRVNPDNGEFTIVAMGLLGANGVAFSNDPTLMYVGSFEGSGVYKVEIPAPGELGKASVFARPNGSTLPEPELACPDQVVGKACAVTTGGDDGKCQRLSNVVDCVPSNPCDGLEEGDECRNGSGLCKSGQCVSKDQLDGCEGLNPGDMCENFFFGYGTCKEVDNQLQCQPPNPCDGKKVGDACNDAGVVGKCTGTDGALNCSVPNDCEGKKDGDACQDLATLGKCQDGYCQPVPCANASIGDWCWIGEHIGTCQGQPGDLACVNQCAGKTDNTACKTADADGKCKAEDCVLVTCTEATVNLLCFNEDKLGYCGEENGNFVCQVGGGAPGGIDGLGVDACGNVYASEWTVGNLWRISPAGEIELLVNLPSGWIPNIKWGRGVGGFERDIMYVADSSRESLFAVSVGVPGVTEFFDLKAK